MCSNCHKNLCITCTRCNRCNCRPLKALCIQCCESVKVRCVNPRCTTYLCYDCPKEKVCPKCYMFSSHLIERELCYYSCYICMTSEKMTPVNTAICCSCFCGKYKMNELFALMKHFLHDELTNIIKFYSQNYVIPHNKCHNCRNYFCSEHASVGLATKKRLCLHCSALLKQ
jgi:hypothetical protein